MTFRTRITDEAGYNARAYMGIDWMASYYVNEDDWFGETWLIIFEGGLAVVVEGDNAQDVIDNLADSDFSHLIDIDECLYCDTTDNHCDCDGGEYAGNDSHRVDTTHIAVMARCEVRK